MIVIHAGEDDVLPLGHQGEDHARQIVFDISGWEDAFGEGTVRLLHQRQGDPLPYPVTIRREGNRVLWDVDAADTDQICRYGHAELRYYAGDALVKSDLYLTSVAPALGPPSPSPAQTAGSDWIQELLDAAARAETVASAVADGEISASDAALRAEAARDAALAAQSAVEGMEVRAVTLDPGADATVTASLHDGVEELTFGIPRGQTGAPATINGVNALTIAPGDNVTISQSGSTLTIAAADTTYAPASPSSDGLLSAGDKASLDAALDLLRSADLYRTVSGDPVVVTDAAAAPVAGLTVQIGPDGTGVSSIAITREGRNLWGNGDITITGWTPGLSPLTHPLPAGTYMFSADAAVDDSSQIPRIQLYAAATVSSSLGVFRLDLGGAGRRQVKITISGTATHYRFFADANNGLSEDKTVTFSQIQAERGAAATAYVPYTADDSVIAALGETVYGGSLDAVSGILTVTHDASGELPTPVTRQLTPQPLSMTAGYDLIGADAGPVTVTYLLDVSGTLETVRASQQELTYALLSMGSDL